jgi:hypothetical protein
MLSRLQKEEIAKALADIIRKTVAYEKPLKHDDIQEISKLFMDELYIPN